jgi:hypothetical protein
MDLPVVYVAKKNPEAAGCQGYHVPEVTQPSAFLFLWDDNCDLVSQAQLAQKQGAVAVLYGLDRCYCEFKDDLKYKSAYEKLCAATPCRATVPVLVQNRERHVGVPVVVITKLDALRLADCYLTSVEEPPMGTGIQCRRGQIIRVGLLWYVYDYVFATSMSPRHLVG